MSFSSLQLHITDGRISENTDGATVDGAKAANLANSLKDFLSTNVFPFITSFENFSDICSGFYNAQCVTLKLMPRRYMDALETDIPQLGIHVFALNV